MAKLKILIITTIPIFLTYFIFSNMNIIMIKGNSMQPTYHNYSIVTYKDLSKDTIITYSDIIYFKQDKTQMVKRIFATSGDVVKCDETLFINNIKTNALCSEKFNYSLKEDQYFVLGDNINQSTDSRVFGLINKEQIIGVIK